MFTSYPAKQIFEAASESIIHSYALEFEFRKKLWNEFKEIKPEGRLFKLACRLKLAKPYHLYGSDEQVVNAFYSVDLLRDISILAPSKIRLVQELYQEHKVIPENFRLLKRLKSFALSSGDHEIQLSDKEVSVLKDYF